MALCSVLTLPARAMALKTPQLCGPQSRCSPLAAPTQDTRRCLGSAHLGLGLLCLFPGSRLYLQTSVFSVASVSNLVLTPSQLLLLFWEGSA